MIEGTCCGVVVLAAKWYQCLLRTQHLARSAFRSSCTSFKIQYDYFVIERDIKKTLARYSGVGAVSPRRLSKKYESTRVTQCEQMMKNEVGFRKLMMRQAVWQTVFQTITQRNFYLIVLQALVVIQNIHA